MRERVHRFDTNVVTRSHLEAARGTEKLEFPTFRKLLRLGEGLRGDAPVGRAWRNR